MTEQGLTVDGLIQIVITPFHTDGSIDFVSLQRLTRSVLDEGASALTALGVSSEAAHLDEDERGQVVATILAASDRAVPLVVGISTPTTALLTARALEAQEAGASAVMVAAPQDASTILDHYAAVAVAAPDVSIVVQDFPPLGHPRIEAATLARLSQEVDTVAAIYHEDPPTPTKMEAVLALAPDLPQVGGLGGLWLPWELRAGAAAVMTGFAFPELMAATVTAARAGDWKTAVEIHHRALRLIVWEAQPSVGLLHRKTMLVARGLIETATLRAPHPSSSRAALDAAELSASLAQRR